MLISFWDFEVLATTWGHLSRLIPRGQKKTEHVPQILVGAGGKSQWWSPYPGFWGRSPQKTWFTEDEQWARHEWKVRATDYGQEDCAVTNHHIPTHVYTRFRIAVIMMFDFQIQNLCLLTYKNETRLGPLNGLSFVSWWCLGVFGWRSSRSLARYLWCIWCCLMKSSYLLL